MGVLHFKIGGGGEGVSKEFLIFLLVLLGGILVVGSLAILGILMIWKIMAFCFAILILCSRWILILAVCVLLGRWAWKKL